jgi:hypothetical protein
MEIVIKLNAVALNVLEALASQLEDIGSNL